MRNMPSNHLTARSTFLVHIASAIETLVEWVGRTVAWLVVVLVLVTVYDVVMRYVLQQGSVAIQEMEWHIFAAIFLLGGAYTLRHDGHVRVDVLYRSRKLSDTARAAIDLAGTVLFLLPFSALMVWSSLDFVSAAFTHNEMSPDPGGLDYRWLAKALIPAGFALIFLQGIAQVIGTLGRKQGQN
jgi:TRAP-type mannitol/chloroaromatic compound transport system permease small subunit